MKLLQNYLYNLSYQILNIILPFITIPYISRVLGADAVGINAYTNTIISYFVLLATLGIGIYGNRTISYVRDNPKELSQNFWEILAVKFLLGTVSIALFIGFTLVYKQYTIFLYAQALQILSAVFEISWLFIGLEDFKKVAFRSILVKLLSFVLILTLVKSPSDLLLYIIIICGTTLIGQLILWTYLRGLIKASDWRQFNMKKHLMSVIALSSFQIALVIFQGINKLFLGNFSTLTETGFYDNSDRISNLLLVLITGVGTVIFPRIANSYKNGKTEDVYRYLDLSLEVITMISLPVVAGVIMISKEFSLLFFGESFSGIEITLSLLILNLLFKGWSTVFGTQFLVAINKLKGVNLSLLVATISASLLAFLLIPTFGSKGAAVVSVAGEAIIAVIQVYFAGKYLDLKRFVKKTSKHYLIYLLATLAMVLVCLGIDALLADSVLQLILQVGLGGLTYLLLVLALRPDYLEKLQSFTSRLKKDRK